MTDDPATPIPDDKDWTWVLERPCLECGFIADTPRPDIGCAIRSAAARVSAALDRPESDPPEVAVEIAVAAERIAARFDGVRREEWNRVGHRSNGSAFTVETFGWYVLHDVVHHAHDVSG